MALPRPEFPNPIWERENWLNLNGAWDFSYYTEPHKRITKKIAVPFCPESELSGVGFTGFLMHCDYKRTFDLTAEQCGGTVLLRFGAVDWEARVQVNGQSAGSHKGGYTSFSLDISKLVHAGENEIEVQVTDRTADGLQASGKQSDRNESYGCMYTRTTGIWQTVWLEFLPKEHLISAVVRPDPENNCVHLCVRVTNPGFLVTKAYWAGELMGEVITQSSGTSVRLTLPLDETHLWEVGKGGLYDLTLSFGDDIVKSYFGLRSVRLDGKRLLLNETTVFQRLVLDQGFYPDGIYTAPTDAALENDIILSQAAGFNGARLHEKVFEPRFLYHADRLGYLCWGEYPNWGLDISRQEALPVVLREWCEAVDRDRNHPAIVGWCPFNETNENQMRDTIRTVYETTKRLDPDRPCIDTSGYVHVKTDIYCLHDYEQNPIIFHESYAPFAVGGKLRDPNRFQQYRGEAVFVSEYGGIGWELEEGWGYGGAPDTEEAFKARYKGLTDVLLDNPNMCAFCYTQLYDVEQEHNGLYRYNRTPKFDISFFHEVNTRKAAIEELTD